MSSTQPGSFLNQITKSGRLFEQGALRLLIFIFVFQIGFLFLHSTSYASSLRCEELFLQKQTVSNKFYNPSLEITKSGELNLKLTQSESVIGKFVNSLARPFYSLVRKHKIEIVTKRLAEDKREDVPFWLKLSDAFGLEIHFNEELLAQIPRTGGLLIVANHPDAVETLAIGAVISRVRLDLKVALTPLLKVLPQISENAIFINPYGGKEAAKENINGLREMRRHLNSGKALLIYPAGEISQKKNLSDDQAFDKNWETSAYFLLKKNPGIKVLPIFAEGWRSQFFYAMTKLNNMLPDSVQKIRTNISGLLHIREIAGRVDTTSGLIIGKVLDGSEILTWGEDAEAMQMLRSHTYDLSKPQDHDHLNP